jgi:hypothetical protein
MLDKENLLEVLILYFDGELDEVAGEDLNRLMYSRVEQLYPENALRGLVSKEKVDEAINLLNQQQKDQLLAFIDQVKGWTVEDIESIFGILEKQLSLTLY